MPELTHAQLAKSVNDLTREIARDSSATQTHAAGIAAEGQDTRSVAESIAALRVDKATVGETNELAKIMEALDAACTGYTSAADYAMKRAQAAHQQNNTSHTGIGEAMSRSSVGAEIYDVDREWLRQE